MKETGAVKFMYWKKDTNKVSEYEASRDGSLISFPFLYTETFHLKQHPPFFTFHTAAF
jgi:hypothetical protein